jgi:Dehydrogenases (flavoproteins)
MENCDVLIVGGGPAGSTCAWSLKWRDIDCIVVDKEAFPRTKLCGGWITPETAEDLELDVNEYPHRLLSFNKLNVHLRGFTFKPKTFQYSIRRYEFDHWLLKRSNVPVFTHEVKHIRRDKGFYIIDDRFRCKYLVGAGGTRCPVYRTLFKSHNPRAKLLQVATLEQEFPYDYQNSNCHLWFFEKGLPGYSWYVPKEKAYLNVGIGAMASQLKRRHASLDDHWRNFAWDLDRLSLVKHWKFEPKGYSYFLRGNVEIGQFDNAFIIGDAAGLASRDMAEGIGPAVRSGILAAHAISQGQQYSPQSVPKYSISSRLMHRTLEYMFIKRKQ